MKILSFRQKLRVETTRILILSGRYIGNISPEGTPEDLGFYFQRILYDHLDFLKAQKDTQPLALASLSIHRI